MRKTRRLERIRCFAALAAVVVVATLSAPAAGADQAHDERGFAGTVDAMIRLLTEPLAPPGRRIPPATTRPRPAVHPRSAMRQPDHRSAAVPGAIGAGTARSIGREGHASKIVLARSTQPREAPHAPPAPPVMGACREAAIRCMTVEVR